MNKFQIYFQKILSFLRVRSIAGGLEISDQVLRLVYFNGKVWQMAAILLGPGVMEKGRIKNHEAFIASLQELKLKIPRARSKNKKINVVVSMSSVNIYSQTFTLPIMEGGDLDSAIGLNVQMLSPTDASQVYSGWQMLGRDDKNLRLEMLAAFIDKSIVEEAIKDLFTAGFVTVGVESRALALMRILREKGAGIDVNKSYLLLNIDNSGLDFLVVRNGQLYFEYADQWTDLADEKGQIPLEKFREALTTNFRQVMNFYEQHWSDPLGAVILCTSAFREETEKTLRAAAALPIINLTLLMGQPISSEWLVALGCSLRGFHSRLHEKEINLAGDDAAGISEREQVLNFLILWRVLVPVALGLLVLIFGITDNLVSARRAHIESQAAFNPQTAQMEEITNLEASSTAFNQSVSLVKSVEAQLVPRYPIIEEVMNLATSSMVTVNHISFQGATIPITVNGTARFESQIIDFKNAIAADPHFGAVNLPLTGIQQNGDTFSFSLTFPLSGQPFAQ